jgi:ectoine hydroxylase-related dioxygenase (phytanoyl-CoA dioxygenase family)
MAEVRAMPCRTHRVARLAAHLATSPVSSDGRLITDDEKQQLDELGYLVLTDFFPREFRDRLQLRLEALYAEEGESAGSEFRQERGSRRLANLVGKDADGIFSEIVLNPVILQSYVSHVLGDRNFKLSSLNARSTAPGNEALTAQPLHADSRAIIDDKGSWVCNVMWLVDEYSAASGPLRLVPRSHLRRTLPDEEMEDPLAPHPDEVHLTGKPGTVLIINAHMWHAGMANRTAADRTSVHAFYCRRDKPQQQYHKAMVSPEAQRGFSPEMRWLLALDDPLNDAVSAAGARVSGFMQ